MSATMTSPKTSKSPRGCGCSGNKATTSSNCGCDACATCQDQGYTRPLFFAGQLLTEDDLQQLTDYVVAKNRLHTRYLAGSGVVCGLQVTCEPCGGGKVIVNPGYALDCCGNDIVLSCPQTLDINAMVRELKLKLRGGYDCGDPCADSTSSKTQGTGTAAMSSSSIRGTGAGTVATPTPSSARKYCLYIQYCEQPSDPVSPYATDAPCGPTITCQPTRVREGFRFELRCPPECETEPPLCCAICNCIGDRTAFERTTTDTESLHAYGRNALEAWEKLKESPTLSIDDPVAYLSHLGEKTAALNNALESLTSAQAKDGTSSSTLPSFSNATFALSRDIALLRIQPAEIQKKMIALTRGSEEISEAERALESASTEFDGLGAAFIAKSFPTTLQRAYQTSLFRLVGKLVHGSDNAAGKTAKASAVLIAEKPIQLYQPSIKLLAAGAVSGPHFQSEAAVSLTAIRDWLVDHLEHSPQTCCDLLREICALTLPTPSTQDEITLSEVQLMGSTSLTLADAVRDVLRSCVCNALNPPCPTCDDTGVLLACLTVENCKVNNICNMDREFVLTPPNIRYWFPEIQRLGKEIEKWCCQCGCPDKDNRTQGIRDSVFGARAESPYTKIGLLLLAGACPDLWSRYTDNQAEPSFTQTFANFGSTFGSPIGGVPSGSATAQAEALHNAVRTATETLQEKLDNARSDLQSMHSEYKKLHERVTRLEKATKQQKGQPEA